MTEEMRVQAKQFCLDIARGYSSDIGTLIENAKKL
jgi:hypothetical protein